MKRGKRVFLTFLLALFVTSSIAQYERFYAAFTYQFTKLINWPNRSGDFVIGVYGTTSVSSFLQQMDKEKNVSTGSIIIKEYNSIGSIGDCNILFVPDDQKINLSAIRSKLGNKKVLIITESPGSITKGSCINFVKVGNNIQVELNNTIIEKIRLLISSAHEIYAMKVT